MRHVQSWRDACDQPKLKGHGPRPARRLGYITVRSCAARPLPACPAGEAVWAAKAELRKGLLFFSTPAGLPGR